MAGLTIDGNPHELEIAPRSLLEVCLALGYEVSLFPAAGGAG